MTERKVSRTFDRLFVVSLKTGRLQSLFACRIHLRSKQQGIMRADKKGYFVAVSLRNVKASLFHFSRSLGNKKQKDSSRLRLRA